MSRNLTHSSTRLRPGLFWPIFLIGVGIIWLLANLGLISVPWSQVWRLWPLFLIVIGLDILFGRGGTWGAVVSVILGLLLVAGVIAFLLVAQNNPALLGANNPTWFGAPISLDGGQLRTQHLADPVGEARQADVTIGFPGGDGSISGLNDSGNLIEGDVTFYGDLTHTVTKNNTNARVELRSESGGPWPLVFGTRPRWDLKLNTAVEYALRLDVGSGNCNFDLSQLNLSSLSLDHGSGSTQLVLPKSGQYGFALDMGSGSVDIRVPQGVAVRVEYHVGSGSLNVNNLQLVRGDSRNGVYESPGFSQSGANVTINVNLGSGNVSISSEH